MCAKHWVPLLTYSEHSSKSSYDYYHYYYYWLGKMKLNQVISQHNSGFKTITGLRAN